MESLSTVCDEYTMDEIKRTIRICIFYKRRHIRWMKDYKIFLNG